MQNKDFNRYAKSLVGCLDVEAGERLRKMFSWSAYNNGIINWDPMKQAFITPLGIIFLMGNPDLKEQVDELEKFLGSK